jgi:hypothetical protein
MNEKIERIKKHFVENKKVYIGIGIGIVVGGVSAGVLFALKNSDSGTKIVQKVQQIGFHNEANPVIVNLIERSTPSKPVHLVGTNLFFNSLHEAARETGHSLREISKNVNGLIPDVKGDVFELLKHT